MFKKIMYCSGVAALAVSSAAFPAPQHAAPAGRAVTSLNTGWRFQLGDAPDVVTTPGFDDAGWSPITVPHTWNRIGEYRTTRGPESNNTQGVGYYRRHITAAASLKGRREYLQFDAVGNIADVWVNGAHIGTHKGAFSGFRFDITEALKPGADNVIVVKADNSKPAMGSSTQDVIPLGGDFFIFGGLYRGVSVIDAPDAGIDLLDHGGPGVYARADHISATSADVLVTTKLRNLGAGVRRQSGLVRIVDATGAEVARGGFQTSIAAHGTTEAHTSLKLVSPHLWNGRADPYMYRVVVTLKEGARTVDAVEQPLGIRSYNIDANTGFFLNGKHIDLHGVSRHQDRPVKGWALSPADHAEDMAIMSDMGANSVRMAHYQHAQEWFNAADKTGMVAWAEIPYVNAASFGDDEGTPALHANAREQLTELIRQNYNHPSVMLWSVGNEVDIGASFGRGKPARSHALLAELNTLAHKEDPSRLTTFADCCEETNPLPGKQTPELLAGATDVMGYNRYYGWYYDAPAKLGPMMDHFHAIHPNLPMSVSEYGAGAAMSQHSDDATAVPIRAWGRPHPEEYQNYYHEESWKQLKARPYIFANWIWNMFDFSSDLRQEGDAIDINDKGMVTYDRKTKKDAFYFYRANWSDAPTLHLTGRRYVDRAYSTNDIKAYANADRVMLRLNGADVGSAPCPDRICVWPNLMLKPGANVLEAAATINGQHVTDTITLNGPDPRAGLRIDVGNLGGHSTADGRRFGSDRFFDGGVVKSLNGSRFGANRNAPQRVVAGADDAQLYDDWREGAFSYTVPLPNGAWMVTLHSFEPDAARATPRSFNVSANGAAALTSFNPAQAAGGAGKAVKASFPVMVTNGMLRLDFSADAVIAAIEIAAQK
jgi:beta-galactosidase